MRCSLQDGEERMNPSQRKKIDSKPVEVISNSGQIDTGTLVMWECSSKDEEDQVCLDLALADQTVSATAETFFEALTEVRKSLEVLELKPVCLGARKDVYPSPMILHMGDGDKAYRMKMGQQALMEHLVSIFDPDPDRSPSSVAEQEAYYQEWLKSL
ncbi:MAG: hypothetical protein NT027_11280 [Proteobacteria bacterium]|nr:hypothetical protein [Pseudomonadota bacterium]